MEDPQIQEKASIHPVIMDKAVNKGLRRVHYTRYFTKAEADFSSFKL